MASVPVMRADAEAAPETDAVTPAVEQALEALRLDWDAAYMIGHDAEHDWWAARRDQIGGYLSKGTPDELREAMAEDHALKPVRFWCMACGDRAVLSGGTAVHAATFSRTGPDGHAADVTDREPPLWQAARRIEADYGGAFTVTARFGILRADWTTEAIGRGVTAAHYEARDEESLRRQLGEALRGVQWGRAREGAAEAP